LSKNEREFQFLQAVVDDLPASELPVAISAEYFPDEKDLYHVAVLLSFDYSELSLLAEAEDLNLEIIIVARDRDQHTRAAVRDNLEIKRQDQHDEARFVYENLLVLESGEYLISGYIRDNRSGKMSRSVHSLALPPNSPVRLSSLVLAGKWEDLGKKTSYRVKSAGQLSILENPLTVAGKSLVPRIGAIFDPSETIYVHGKVNVWDQPSNLEYRVVLTNDTGEKLFEGNWKALTSAGDHLLDVNARLPLDQLSPGSYRLLAEIRSSDSQTLELAKGFTVMETGGW
jgi:hypothetical protein